MFPFKRKISRSAPADPESRGTDEIAKTVAAALSYESKRTKESTRLGRPADLHHSVACTNSIENIMGTVGRANH